MMPQMSDVLRYVAFSDRPDGGNPAGVVLDAAGMSDDEMLQIAADLGYSESAFVNGQDIRYFSPLAEVPFCGHATIATAVALADRDGPGEVVLNTMSGPVPITSRRDDQGRLTATLTSVPRAARSCAATTSTSCSPRLAGRQRISTPSSRRASPTPGPGTR